MSPKAYVALFIMIPGVLFAGTVEFEFNFQLDELRVTKYNNYDLIKLPGCGHTIEPGAPYLPVRHTALLVPPDCRVDSIVVVKVSKTVLPRVVTPYPVQEPYPISVPIEHKFIPPAPQFYNLPEYPTFTVRFNSDGYINGYHIANLTIAPVHYLGRSKQLEFITYLKLRIYTSYRPARPHPYNAIKAAIPRIREIVYNPEDIDRYQPPTLVGYRSPVLSPDTIYYVIITVDEFVDGFNPLKQWKTQKGVPAEIVTTDWIYSNYSGRDDAEKLRNFIIDAYNAWGAMYFLLGGQADYENGEEFVPRRDVYYITTGVGYYPDEDTIPTDLYYSDLDGDWNADNDNVWGEREDSVDLYSDVYVGRAPVKNISQVENFVNKVINYEQGVEVGYQTHIMLVGADLWPWLDYNGDIVSEAISQIVPEGWRETKLYYVWGNLSTQRVIDTINSGVGFAHYAAHGNEYGVYWESDGLTNSNLWQLTNGYKLGVHNAISCFSGALDEVPGGDCFAEELVNKPHGGAVATIMNTRYGWGTPPELGPSERLDTAFYHHLFVDDVYELGKLHAMAHDDYVPWVTWQDIEAYCIYELTVFGDPELNLWTTIPGSLYVDVPDSLLSGTERLVVTVMDSSNNPVTDARVVVHNENGFYRIGYTNVIGKVEFTLPATLEGELTVVVVKHNHIPYQTTIPIVSATGPYLVYGGTVIDDDTVGQTHGNGDSMLDPGELTEIWVKIKNVGTDSIVNVTGRISCTDPYMTILCDTTSYTSVAPDSTVMSGTPFVVELSPSTPNNYAFTVLLSLETAVDTWGTEFILDVPEPILTIVGDSLIEPGGDGYASSGEVVSLYVKVTNSGPVTAYGVVGQMWSPSPYVAITVDTQRFGDIMPGDTGVSMGSYQLAIAPACPRVYEVPLVLEFTDDNPYSHDWQDTFMLQIWAPGEILVVDDGLKADSISLFLKALDTLGYSYDVVKPIRVDTNLLSFYPMVIWSCGWNFPTLTDEDQAHLAWFLDHGGALFISGQDIGWDFNDPNGYAYGDPFYEEYLHARYIRDDTDILTLIGVAGDPIGDSLVLSLEGGDGANNQQYPSEIDTLNGSLPVFYYEGDGIGVIRYVDPVKGYRVVYWASGFEAINNAGDRCEVMSRIINWLEGGPWVAWFTVSPQWAQPGDTFTIRTKTYVMGQSEAIAKVKIYVRVEEEVIDSLYLYDDGLHADSVANDSIYGNEWVTDLSADFWLDLSVTDLAGDTTYRRGVGWCSTLLPAMVAVTPDSVYVEVMAGDTVTSYLQIMNTGEHPLTYRIEPLLQFDGSPKPMRMEPHAPADKDGTPWQPGPPVVMGAGGPDSFGYRWIDSDEGIIEFNWREISDVGIEIDGFGDADDDNVGPFDIGFGFTFYGDTFTKFRFCTNGFISFTSTADPWRNLTIPNPEAPGNLVAPFWDDLDFRYGGHAYYYSTGDTLIVEYKEVPHYGGDGGPYTFQVLLLANGDIIFQYKDMYPPRNSATIGIQNATGDVGLQIAYNTSYVHDSMAVLIYRGVSWLQVTPRVGEVPPGDTVDVRLTFDATTLDEGIYRARLNLQTNAYNVTELHIPVVMRVTPVTAAELMPKSYRFMPPAPNPSMGKISFMYGVPQTCRVCFVIYNAIGQKVLTLVERTERPGYHEYTGELNLPSGVYFYRFEADKFKQMGKLILVR